MESAGSGREGLRLAEEKDFDAMLLDLRMPDLDGLEVLRRIRRERPEITVIIITGYPTDEARAEVERLGAFDLIAKPFTPEDLWKVVGRVLQKREARPAEGPRIVPDTLAAVSATKIKTVAVLGGGCDAPGIAECMAAGGVNVILMEKDEDAVENSMADIHSSLDHQIERWSLTSSEKKAALSRILATADDVEVTRADLVVDALPEDLGTKNRTLRTFDAVCPGSTIFVTNAWTIEPAAIGAGLSRPDRFMGVHFPYPPERNPIVELVSTSETTDSTRRRVREFLRSLGKEPIEVDNHCGLVSTRMMLPLINEAFHMVMEGVAGAADVDRTMKMASGMSIPPLELADRMGLDVVLQALNNCSAEFGDGKFRPCPLLQRMVREGRLGMKTGAGVFEYRLREKVLPVDRQA